MVQPGTPPHSHREGMYRREETWWPSVSYAESVGDVSGTAPFPCAPVNAALLLKVLLFLRLRTGESAQSNLAPIRSAMV